MFHDHGAAEGAALVAHHVFEDAEFLGGEFDGFADAGDFAAGAIEVEIAHLQAFRGGLAAAQKGANTGEEFHEREGLGEVVIGTLFETFDTVIDLATGTEDEDGRAGAAGANTLQDLQSVHIRQTEVEDDEVVIGVAGELDGVGAVIGDVDGVPGTFQTTTQEVGNSLFIFNHENAHVDIRVTQRFGVASGRMLTLRISLLTVVGALAVWGQAAPKTRPMAVKAPAPDPWEMVFSDEFDGGALEFPKWSPHDPWGKERNLEVQAYVPESIELREGMARLVARVAKATYDGKKRDYTSGMLTTFGSFAQMYGRFEVRCRFPAGKGLEPKVWLLPVPNGENPAIDIVDFVGREPGRVLFGNLWGDTTTERAYQGSWPLPDLTREFHTYAIEWDEGKIVWQIDGKERFRSTSGVPRQPMYLAMSLAVGGELAKWPDSTTVFPAVFEIDYVRIYKRR